MTTKLFKNGKLVSIKQSITHATEEVTKMLEAEETVIKPFVTDVMVRALHTFWQTLIPGLILFVSATSVSDAKATGLSALTAASAAALSFVKGIIISKLQENK